MMEKDQLKRLIEEERARVLEVYKGIQNGTLSFDDFWYGFLDDARNQAFGEGYLHAKDEMSEDYK